MVSSLASVKPSRLPSIRHSLPIPSVTTSMCLVPGGFWFAANRYRTVHWVLFEGERSSWLWNCNNLEHFVPHKSFCFLLEKTEEQNCCFSCYYAFLFVCLLVFLFVCFFLPFWVVFFFLFIQKTMVFGGLQASPLLSKFVCLVLFGLVFVLFCFALPWIMKTVWKCSMSSHFGAIDFFCS